MRLMRFSYSISHVPGNDLVTAATLSQVPDMESIQPNDKCFQDDCQMQSLVHLQATAGNQASTRWWHNLSNDSALGRAKLESDEKVYLQVSTDLTIQQGLLLKASPFVIPIAERYEGHQGIVKCQEHSKQSVWWQEDLVDRCARESKPCRANDVIHGARLSLKKCVLRPIWAEQI